MSATPRFDIDKSPSRSKTPGALDRIVLTGFMGSGKTTTGALLAQKIGWRFFDLDREIERRDGRTVPAIFSAPPPDGGEACFRRLESAALASMLQQTRIVLALGGGAPETQENRLLLQQVPHTAVIYLSGSFPDLLARCYEQAAQPSATARPVLADASVAERRFHLRDPLYRSIASHIIDTSELSPAATVGVVLHLLQSSSFQVSP